MNNGALNSTERPSARQAPSGRTVGSACATWDLTVWHDQCTDRTDLRKFLTENAKKFSYQLEKNGDGKLHWQIRLSLFKKKKKFQLLATIPFANTNVSPTSSDVHAAKKFNYVMKADTRVDGPWTDTDDVEPPKLTKQLERFMRHTLRPWQTEIVNLISLQDDDLEDRKIIYILDEVGNSGKSIFCEWLEFNSKAYEIPMMSQMEDIMQCCMCIKEQSCYIIDMPRGLKKDKLASFFGGVECLKNGVMYDKRYAFKKRRIDRPNVVIFSNCMPDLSLLSGDRWSIYIMQPDYSLKKHDPSVHDLEHYLHAGH